MNGNQKNTSSIRTISRTHNCCLPMEHVLGNRPYKQTHIQTQTPITVTSKKHQPQPPKSTTTTTTTKTHLHCRTLVDPSASPWAPSGCALKPWMRLWSFRSEGKTRSKQNPKNKTKNERNKTKQKRDKEN